MEHTHRFAGVAPDAVYREFISRDFLLAFSTEVGVTSGDLQTSSEDGAGIADMQWSFPTARAGIPSLAQKMLPGEVKLDWHQSWGPAGPGDVPGSIRVALHGSPSAEVTAIAKLAGTGSDTLYTIKTKTKTSLRWPVAGTVEGTIDKELVRWILRVQARVLRRRLGLPEE